MPLAPELIFLVDLLALFAIYAIVVISLNLEFGYAGVPNFGKVLPVAGGAFVAGYLPGRLASSIMGLGGNLDYIKDNVRIVTAVNSGVFSDPIKAIAILFVTLLVAGLTGAALGFVASYPSRRLREDYLAITLLAMGEGIRVIGYNYGPLVGGTLGVQVPDAFAWAGGEMRFTVATVFLVLMLILVFFYVERTVNSPLGRTLRAIRDNETAAASLGKNIVRFRTNALLVGSALGAIGGALYAFYTGGVIAVAYNRVDWTFWPWLMMMLGGASNNKGAVVGTAIFATARKLIIFYKASFTPFMPFDVVWLDMLLLGFVLIVILMYRPEGLMPERPVKTVERKKT